MREETGRLLVDSVTSQLLAGVFDMLVVSQFEQMNPADADV